METRGRGRNLRSQLRRRRRQGSSMQAYDALPRELRLWLASACLPWSPGSARRIWDGAGGAHNPMAAAARLDAIERAMMQRDAGIWTPLPQAGMPRTPAIIGFALAQNRESAYTRAVDTWAVNVRMTCLSRAAGNHGPSCLCFQA